MQYVTVSEHELSDARAGLELLAKVSDPGEDTPLAYIYGITNKADVLLAAQKDIASSFDEEAGESAPVP